MQTINPDSVMRSTGGYSQGISSGEWIFVAGQVGMDANKQPTGDGGMAAQTRQALANVAAVLAEAGATLNDVVTTTVYVTSFEAYAEFDQAWQEHFGDHRPARATVRADLVAPGLLVEIQAIAMKPGDTLL